MIRLLVVDDSALLRNLLAQLFAAEGDFEVELAKTGLEAIEKNRSFLPDVVTLDINMPEMDGIAALSRIMADRPVPVVMLSSMTERGALATLEALNLGAVDFVTKPDGIQCKSLEGIRSELLAKVRGAKGAKLKAPLPAPPAGGGHAASRNPNPPVGARAAARQGVVLMGGSIGGPRTAEEILGSLPADLEWPVVVALQMTPEVSRSFVEKLEDRCDMEVVEAVIPMVVRSGTIYLAPGGKDLEFTSHEGRLAVVPKPATPLHPWHPSLDLLARSALEHCDPRGVLAVMLTGMGCDGADSFAEIHRRGGRTIAESEDSAVVFDMPRELIRRGGATAVLPLGEIADRIVEWVDR